MLACAPLNIWVVNALKSSLESLNTIESQRTSAPRELYWYSWINSGQARSASTSTAEPNIPQKIYLWPS